jgi:organic hydroperoxide reductase OsmC/OhrA
MQPLPHSYSVGASTSAAGTLVLTAEGVSDLVCAPPREFDGPGDQWSPESLLVAALAGCFALTFRAVARVSKLEWTKLECAVQATLDRIEGVPQFTQVVTHATLTVSVSTSAELCTRVLEKAEQGCLVANSLRSRRELKIEIWKVG